MRRPLQPSPNAHENLHLPEGLELRTTATKFDGSYNSKRKKSNHIRKISQHLVSSYSQHYPDIKVKNMCHDMLKNNHGTSPYFIFVFKKDGIIWIAPMDYGILSNVIFAKVFYTVETLGIKEEDILAIYYSMYPKGPDMEWQEWKENASQGILADGGSLFRSLDYYERLVQYNENTANRRRKR